MDVCINDQVLFDTITELETLSPFVIANAVKQSSIKKTRFYTHLYV